MAHGLGARVGDGVTLSTPFGMFETRISGVLQEFGSSEGYLLRDFVHSTDALLRVRGGEVKRVESSL